jgi:uncharacterized protein CbrC (UPF0167 family)
MRISSTLNPFSPAALAPMSSDARVELEFRTPSFLCFQQPEWLDHHGKAAAYLGEVGFDEYLRLPLDAQRIVRYCVGDKPDEPLRAIDFVQRLWADGDDPQHISSAACAANGKARSWQRDDWIRSTPAVPTWPPCGSARAPRTATRAHRHAAVRR